MNTCADCKYHECKNNCVKNKKCLCDGLCKKNPLKSHHRRCEEVICKHFKLDQYFYQFL